MIGCKNCGCGCNCNCNDKKCDKVLEKYHYLIKKSDDLYAHAVEEQSEAINYVVEAIESLEEFKCLFKESYEVYDEATQLLENSNCASTCNVNSCKCKNLDKKADELYYKQLEEVYEALELLQKSLCELNEAVEYGLAADKVYDAFTSCVHGK